MPFLIPSFESCHTIQTLLNNTFTVLLSLPELLRASVMFCLDILLGTPLCL